MQRQSAYGIALFTCRPNSTTEALYTLFGWEFPKGGSAAFFSKVPKLPETHFPKVGSPPSCRSMFTKHLWAKYLKKPGDADPGSFVMSSRVYATVGRPSVCLSICPMRLPHDAVVGTVCCCSPPAGSGYRLLQQRRAVTRCHRG